MAKNNFSLSPLRSLRIHTQTGPEQINRLPSHALSAFSRISRYTIGPDLYDHFPAIGIRFLSCPALFTHGIPVPNDTTGKSLTSYGGETSLQHLNF